MKKLTITNAQQAIDIGNPKDMRLTGFEIEGPEEMECSDGYHTFSELYEHRIALYLALCKKINAEDELNKSMRAFKEGFAFDRNSWIREVWRSKLHSDGTSFDGWFVLGVNKEEGKQITYHLPLVKWEETNFAETLDKAPEFDGHTAHDVLERFKKL